MVLEKNQFHLILSLLANRTGGGRCLLSQCLNDLKIDSYQLRSYSFRRGGATHPFVHRGILDQVLLLGRWTALKTAKICLNSGLAMLADLQIPLKLLKPFHLVFDNSISLPLQLEPTLQKRRTGGHGKKVRGKELGC